MRHFILTFHDEMLEYLTHGYTVKGPGSVPAPAAAILASESLHP